jgi:serine/threonine protein kinase
MTNFPLEVYQIETIVWQSQIKAEIFADVSGINLKNKQIIDLLKFFCFDPFDQKLALEEIEEKRKKLKNNKNIDHINKVFTQGSNQIVLTYNNYPSLSTVMANRTNSFSQQEIIDYSFQLMNALTEMHENEIIHDCLHSRFLKFTETGLRLRGFFIKNTNVPVDKSWNDKVAPGYQKNNFIFRN